MSNSRFSRTVEQFLFVGNVRSLAALFFSAVVIAGFGAEPGRVALPGHMPKAVAGLAPKGRLAVTNDLRLAIGLPLRDPAGLDRFLAEVYDPASLNFRKYLTPEEFTARFGPTESDYAAVKEFARTNGLAIIGTHPNRLVLDVAGLVPDIEQTFHVTLRTYRHPREAREFFAPDAEPQVNTRLPALHISGLDNYALRRPMSVARPMTMVAQATPRSGSGSGGSYLGNDFRAAYVPGATLTGSGQSVALLQFDGYHSNDIAAYISQAGLTNYPVSLTNVAVNGGVSTPGSGNGEVCLDIEMVLSMAPGISKIIVYEGPNGSTPWSTILSQIANDNLARQVSCSWGDTSVGSPDPTSEAIFKQMAAQGQSFFNASGDSDAFVGGIPFPSESTNITQVGGTTLSTTGPGGAWSSETAWNWGYVSSQSKYIGTGGGVSANYGIPAWQQGISMTANHGSTTMRNVPDVALTGDNVFVTYSNGLSGVFGGTSCAAPLWAGFMALVNQQAAAAGNQPVGFVNPAIYAIGQGAGYNACFHDTTSGDNFTSASPTNFPAVTGFDLCTGWGTPNGTNLINALAVPFTLIISPPVGFTSYGAVGGPFNVTNQSLQLTNRGAASLNWTLASSPPWLAVAPVAGTLAGGGKTNLVVTLTSAANTFTAAVYSASLSISNLADGTVQSVPFTLHVGQSLVRNGGFETGAFTDWTLDGNTVSGGTTFNTVADTSSWQVVHSGSFGAFLGDIQVASLSQVLPTVPGQGYLLSLWLDNPTSGSTQIFHVNWNTNSVSTNTIYSLLNPPVLPWTNLQFVVTATGTNTTLQFGAENDPNYFGLDDVNVTPIPMPTFTSFSKKTNGLSLTWNALAGIAYQVQYKTNLLQTNWISLSTNTATGNSISVTNTISADPRRFYRVRRLP